jgi:hypothetical protein
MKLTSTGAAPTVARFEHYRDRHRFEQRASGA